MKKRRKILYISGTRADYGLMRETFLAINKTPELELEIIITGMHLMPEFGQTIAEIKKDNFKIHTLNAVYKRDEKESMVKFIGAFLLLITKKIKRIRPDFILILGDRAEALAGAIAGSYMTIPVLHIHGGDVSATVDEMVRHAITKLSHIHFAATKKSAERLIKMGENYWRVFVVGAPGLDDILNRKLLSPEKVAAKYKLNLKEPILLVLQHPVTIEAERAGKQIRETLEAVKELGFKAIVIYPNADAGGRKMIEAINQYENNSFIQIHKNLPRLDYLSLMRIASVIVGNSSSGIIEAPSFALPVVNIGEREKEREKTEGVINVGYNKEEIKKAIKKAIDDKTFIKKVKKCKNPYGDGIAGIRIADILAKIKINKKLLQKQITY